MGKTIYIPEEKISLLREYFSRGEISNPEEYCFVFFRDKLFKFDTFGYTEKNVALIAELSASLRAGGLDKFATRLDFMINEKENNLVNLVCDCLNNIPRVLLGFVVRGALHLKNNTYYDVINSPELKKLMSNNNFHEVYIESETSGHDKLVYTDKENTYNLGENYLPNQLYHGTTLGNAIGIVKGGLKPNPDKSNFKEVGVRHSDTVFLCKDITTACGYSAMYAHQLSFGTVFENIPVVIEYDVNKMDKNRFVLDFDVYTVHGSGNDKPYEDLFSSMPEKIADRRNKIKKSSTVDIVKDNPLKFNRIGYRGVVMPSAIKKIYVFGDRMGAQMFQPDYEFNTVDEFIDSLNQIKREHCWLADIDESKKVLPPYERDTFEIGDEGGNNEYFHINEDNTFASWFGKSVIVDADGKPMKMYHGSGDEFEEFKKEFIGRNGAHEGYGFNFTPFEGRARAYNGGNVLEVYLRAENPMTTKSYKITPRILAKVIAEIDKGVPYNSTVVAAFEQPMYKENWDERYYRRALPVATKYIYDYNVNGEYGDAGMYADICLCGNGNVNKVIEVFESLGYDSAIFYDDRDRINTVVVFEPNQIKKINNKTYNNASNLMGENVELELDADEVNLSSFKKKDKLADKLWKGFNLNPKARLRLLDIADDFWETVDVSWVKPSKIILTGSICNFNWSKYSDIDLHLVVDFSKVDERADFVQEYFDGKKNDWNNKHKKLKIYGYPVEVYVEDINAKTESGGIYDLEENKWIKKPVKDDIKDIKLDKYSIKNLVAKYCTKIDNICDEAETTDDSHVLGEIGERANKLLNRIRKMRKFGLERSGESDPFNIAYKCYRRMGYLDKLFDIKSELYDRVKSISESRKVGLTEDVNPNDVFEKLKQNFGVTNNIMECGYVLPDGTLLDFSGRHEVTGKTDASSLIGRRSVDHRKVIDVGTSMSAVIRMGAIRIDVRGCYAEMYLKPTQQQISVLREFVRKNYGCVTIEIGDGDESLSYIDYDDATPSRVIADILRYFDEGIRLEGNVNESKEILKEFLDNEHNIALYKYFKWADTASDEEKVEDIIYRCGYETKEYISKMAKQNKIFEPFRLELIKDEELIYDDDFVNKIANVIVSNKLTDAFICYLTTITGGYDLPSWVFMHFRRVVKNEWCIHFGADSFSIAREGFTGGTEDIEGLAYTNAGQEKHRPGYDFAFPIGERNVDSNNYGNEAVIFQTSGVEIYHDGDNQKQVVFWGPYAKNFIPIKWDEECGEWTVRGRKGNILKSGWPSEIADWAIDNLPQYRKQIMAGKNGFIPRYYSHQDKKLVPYPFYRNESKEGGLVLESQESKSISAAKKLVMQKFGYDDAKADKFVRITLRNDIPSLRTPEGGKFILGVTRMYCDGELGDANTIGNLNKTIKLVASDAHINEYDRNLNGMSAQDLIDRFATSRGEMLDADKQNLSKMEFQTNNDYEIVRIDSFEQASEYSKYTSWCVTHYENMFDSYTSDGYNQFYFCLKHGFENLEPIKSEGCPLDEYGLSMIAVSVDADGGLNTCTCRWNHDNGGNDGIMDTKQISSVIGANFYDVFKPNNKWKEILYTVTGRLASGEMPEYIFDKVSDVGEGLRVVVIKNKMNLINDKQELICDKWFDDIYRFTNGFAVVEINYNFNFITPNGKLISDLWFDNAFPFNETGFAEVQKNRKCNLINTKGKLLSDIWFEKVNNNFEDGFARVWLNEYKINYISTEGNLLSNQWFVKAAPFSDGIASVAFGLGKWNYINTEGKFLSDQWFISALAFRDGFGLVKIIGNKWNFIDKNGKFLSDQWFDYITYFHENFAKVQVNGKWNFIDKNGKFLSDQWFDFAFDFDCGMAEVELNGKEYKIDLDGKLHRGFNESIDMDILEESVFNYIKTLKEEVNARGNANHDIYRKRWNFERKCLKQFLINNGTVMTSKENGKTYYVYYDTMLSNLIGVNYCICLQYDMLTGDLGRQIYVRAIDKFSPRMFKPQRDTRGLDNAQTLDDVSANYKNNV